MGEKETNNEAASAEKQKPEAAKSFAERATLWVGIIGTLVTIALTIWNSQIKAQIDQREEKLKILEMNLKERTADVEESKERVDRYKWVLSLFPDLNEKDERKRNFTVSLIRLALTKGEAEQLFAGLQTSSDKELQSVGQNGITAIQNEPISLLVSQMNASSTDVRKSAVAALVNDYKSSSQAIAFVLTTFEPDKIDNLSPSAIINGLYFLSATDPNVWKQPQVEAGRQLISRIEARGAGSQTKAALDTFRPLLQKAAQNP